jgi:hypothetical protein
MFGFAGVFDGFAGAFIFGGMAARRERLSGRREKISSGREGEIWGKLVEIGVVRMTGGAHARNGRDARRRRARSVPSPTVGAGAGLPMFYWAPNLPGTFDSHSPPYYYVR